MKIYLLQIVSFFKKTESCINYFTGGMVSIAVIGYPSAGKSSLINAVIRRSVCNTAMKRTTEVSTEYTVESINQIIPNSRIERIISSDDIEISKIIDVPGLSDSGDIEKNFDKITFEVLTKVDIVIWCTDSNNAFLTVAEFEAFQNIRSRIDKNASTTGHACILQIYMTKFDVRVDMETVFNSVEKPSSVSGGEIETEDSDVFGLMRGVYEKTGIKPIPFNAFGLSLLQGSESLRKLILKKCNPTPHNTQFNLKPAIDQLPYDRDRAAFRTFIDGSLTQYRVELVAKFDSNKYGFTGSDITDSFQLPISINERHCGIFDRYSFGANRYRMILVAKPQTIVNHGIPESHIKDLVDFILIKTQKECEDFGKKFNITCTGVYSEALWNNYSTVLRIESDSLYAPRFVIDDYGTLYPNCLDRFQHVHNFRLYNIMKWNHYAMAAKLYYTTMIKTRNHPHNIIGIVDYGINFGVLGDWVPDNCINIDVATKPLNEIVTNAFVNKVIKRRSELGLEYISEAMILTRIMLSRTTGEFLSVL
jgi:GTPase SAR1 family protein